MKLNARTVAIPSLFAALALGGCTGDATDESVRTDDKDAREEPAPAAGDHNGPQARDPQTPKLDEGTVKPQGISTSPSGPLR
jgi:hypothetical protein